MLREQIEGYIRCKLNARKVMAGDYTVPKSKLGAKKASDGEVCHLKSKLGERKVNGWSIRSPNLNWE